MQILEKEKKMEKNFLVSEMIDSELVSLNCLYEEQDNCYRQPMC